MASLQLTDITNLPSSLPTTQIPPHDTQSEQGRLHVQPHHCHRLQPHPAFLKDAKYHHHHHSHQQQQQQQQQQHGMTPQHQRLSALTGNDSGFHIMDDSLTDMRWLQRMDAGSDFPGLTHDQCRKKMAVKGTRAMGKDGCRKKLEYSSKKGSNKPPLSYASLIALAICSTPQRMMTLSNIYRWIEYTFPFYRTPEAKAWKNSIRHNLSIRKNMFMKVFQYPPRRGNGSYWTLLSDGEEELQKAVPLFATLQPPVIDSNSMYHREPNTHTVKSKGKFVPVLPRADGVSTVNTIPYFSIGASASSVQDGGHFETSEEVVVIEGGESSSSEVACNVNDSGGDHQWGVGGVTMVGGRIVGKHLCDHSYAKSWRQDSIAMATEKLRNSDDGSGSATLAEVVVELATGGSSEGVVNSGESDKRFSDLVMLPKKKRQRLTSTGKGKTCPPAAPLSSEGGISPSFTTPPKDQDTSLHLLDSSFLTPLKTMSVPDIEIGTISFSPLYANLATPKREHGRGQASLEMSSHTLFPSPLTPLRSSLDSGIFSPLQSDPLGGMKFSTPTSVTSLSPLANLSSFSSLQPELYPFKGMENSVGCGQDITPLRPGSLQALGLPGLTPPCRK